MRLNIYGCLSKFFTVVGRFSVLLLVSFTGSAESITTPPDWIIQSNRVFDAFNLDFAAIYPEAGSQFGATQFDKEASVVVNDMETPKRAFVAKWTARLKQMLPSISDPNLRNDVQLLLDSVSTAPDFADAEIGNIDHLATEFSPPRLIGNILGLLFSPDTPTQRKRDVVERFHRYVRGYGDAKPTLIAQQNRIEYLLALPQPSTKLLPSKSDLHHDLNTIGANLAVLHDFLVKSGVDGWEEDFAEFQKQTATFNQYIVDRILPLARTDDQVPPEVYTQRLRNNGIEVSAEELIRLGQQDYAELYPQFLRLIKVVANRNGLPQSDPISVMSFLRQKKVVHSKDVIALFTRVEAVNAEIIRKYSLLTIPDDPLVMRVMTSSESKASPIPFLQPPPLVGNKGEKPEFLMPTAESGATLDDFSYEAAAHSLLAHEGRPGHDLQMRSLTDSNRISNIRRTYAWNSANIEGWGMYSEMELFPYFSPEEQLAGLQLRCLRILRMIMEPQFSLGQVTKDQIGQKIQNDLGFTESWAKTEAWRYSTLSGQAPSYQYGYRKLLAIKARFKQARGTAFSEKCFNDGYLSIGLLPIDKIGDRMVAEIKCD